MPFRILEVARLASLATILCTPALAQFEMRSTSQVSGSADPYSCVIGDFDRDGIADLAVVNTLEFGGGSVEILLGNGDGTFRSGATYTVTAASFYGATASLRNNGVLDIVLGGLDDNAYVMLGNGDGTFQDPVPYPTSASSYMVGLGDFTGHGNFDIVAIGGTSDGVVCDCIEVLPGNGDGTFGAVIAAPLPYSMTAYALATGDFNNDGKLDVAVQGEGFPNYQVAILLGNGDGTFTADGYYLVAEGGSIATGYFTGNKKKIDLAVASYGSIGVLLGNGDGTFQQAVNYNVGLASWVTARDLNGDGKVDLAVAGEGPGPQYPPGVTSLSGNGNGTFQPGVFYPTGKIPQFASIAELNDDRKPDLVLTGALAGEVITLLNTGVVSFSPTTPLNFKKQAVGTTSAAQTVTLTNTGTTELKVQSMKASAEFAMKSTCGQRVAPGANCTISAKFSPTKQGAQQGTITILDNASSKPQVIELLGTGT